MAQTKLVGSKGGCFDVLQIKIHSQILEIIAKNYSNKLNISVLNRSMQ